MTTDLRRALEGIAAAAGTAAGAAPADRIRARVLRRQATVRAGRGVVGAGVATAVAVGGFQATRPTPVPSQTPVAPPTGPMIDGWDCGERATGLDTPLLAESLHIQPPVSGIPGGTLDVGVRTPDDVSTVYVDASSGSAGPNAPTEPPAAPSAEPDGRPARTQTVGGTVHTLVLVVTDETGRVVAEGAEPSPSVESPFWPHAELIDPGFGTPNSPPYFRLHLASCVDGTPLPAGDYLVQGVWRVVSTEGTVIREVTGASLPVVVGDLSPGDIADAEMRREAAQQDLGRRQREAEEAQRRQIVDALVANPSGSFWECGSLVPAPASEDVTLTVELGHGGQPHYGRFVTVRAQTESVVLDGLGAVVRVVVARDGVVVGWGGPEGHGDVVGRLDLAPGAPVTLGLPGWQWMCTGGVEDGDALPPGTYQLHAVIDGTLAVAGGEPQHVRLVSDPVDLVVER